MSTQTSDQEICQAVLDFAAEGTYPDSEQIVAAEFPQSALAKELELITKARDQVEAEISSLSRENDFDADGWISQAKQLHADLEKSRLTAREIVKQHENTGPLQSKIEDATAKAGLIEKEIVFNQAVTSTLEEVQRLCQQLDTCRTLYKEGNIIAAIDTLEAVDHAVNRDSSFRNTNVMGILLENIAGLRREIIDFLHVRWDEVLLVDQSEGKLVVSENTLEETISALTLLDEFTPANNRFQKGLFLAIVDPLLLPDVDGYSHEINIDKCSVHVGPEPSRVTVSELLGRVAKVLGFLHQHLPTAVLSSFSDSFIPTLSSRIISHWLSSAIPTELDGLQEFESILNEVLEFSKTIEAFNWHGQEELVSWVNQAPRLWLTRRRVDSLDQVRKALAASKGNTRQVERVEKKQVSETDEVLLENSTSDDWDAGWDDDKEGETGHTVDEDVSAWGFDDDTSDAVDSKPETSTSTEDDDVGDAWGWGEDEDDQPSVEITQPKASTKSANGDNTAKTLPKEVTLKETYTVTDVPDCIIEIIRRQILDSEVISQPTQSHPLVGSSGAGLLALPTLILAMFKATAPSFYSLKPKAGQMHLYNDSLYLAGQVHQVAEEHQLPRLHTDIEALEKFGKFAYSKEMQTQRTIVTDLLDGAQGFSQCSEQPFLGECENAVSATVERVRYVFKEWQPILSHSALLQSIGSLVSTVINKLIIDIEDLGDISESQSQRLVSFCNSISNLENLFLPENSDNAESIPLTAVYVRGWLKFQYLVNILESSLADIKFLWVDGELSLEFSADEVVDLIEALFAESDYRRKAIADIRRHNTGFDTAIHTSLSLISRLKMNNDQNPAADSSSQSAQRQVRVQLISQQEDVALPENTGPILVPTGLRRYALSTLVNNLLGNDKPVPFEFLVNGAFLRTSIDEYLTANGISAETTLEIEYVRALIPPLHIASFEHDDWVSSVDVLSATSPASNWSSKTVSQGQERILSGSYDGLLRVWNMSSQIIATSPSPADGGHTSSIKATKFVSPTSIVSAGLDRTVRLWKYSESDDGFSAKISPQLELYGHKSGVNSLAVHAPSNRILSASADHSVGFWSTKKSDAPAAPESLLPSAVSRTSKRRKLNTSVSVSQRGPLALLSAHTAPVSAAIFDAKDSTVGYSASWDHSLRTWDLVTAALVDTRTTSHSLLSLEHLPDHHLLATGTSARHITLIDPRASAATISAMTLRGHTNAVVTLARDPHSTYGLISGSHDAPAEFGISVPPKPTKTELLAKACIPLQGRVLRKKARRIASVLVEKGSRSSAYAGINRLAL
ncbi:hypothetical protein AOCH_003547 [Aspergillus ochraceoroseus]|uniref:Ribosome biogenesis protein YTM1 n=1 Tax=Aspergillus ochraceoroseus TaxID=138278 RepID=A0A0F8UJS1_9EURO|nr:hypothetical protein AOCH_003547 [Aspergillus ochraceoroseus]